MKKNKLLVGGIVCFMLAAIAFGITIPLGLFNRDTWASANSKLREKQGFYPEPVKMSYVAEADITSINMDTASKNVLVTRGDVEKATVDYYEDYEGEFGFSVDENGVFSVKQSSKEITYKNFFNMDYQWIINLFDSNWESYLVKVTLPTETILDKMDIKSLSGGVEINNIETLELNVNITSGGFDIKSSKTGKTSVDMISGGFDIENSETDELFIKLTSGGLDIDNSITGNFTAELISGGIDIDSLTSENVIVKSSSGGVEIDNATATSFNADLSSGGIDIDNLKADSVTVKSLSGTVEINNSEIKSIDAKLTSGGIKIKNIAGATEGAVSFDVKTFSGRVKVFGDSKGDTYKADVATPVLTVKAELSSGSFVFE